MQKQKTRRGSRRSAYKHKKARPGFPGTCKTCAMPQNKKGKEQKRAKEKQAARTPASCRVGGAML